MPRGNSPPGAAVSDRKAEVRRISDIVPEGIAVKEYEGSEPSIIAILTDTATGQPVSMSVSDYERPEDVIERLVAMRTPPSPEEMDKRRADIKREAQEKARKREAEQDAILEAKRAATMKTAADARRLPGTVMEEGV